MRRSGMLPVAFGGLLSGAGAPFFRITELSGADTGSLRGLQVRTGNGLGGKTLALRRPYAVTDYGASRTISHEYDAAVAGEGLRSVLAVPIVVQRQVRGVLYGALRQPFAIGDRPLSAAMDAARDLEQALVIRDEARRLLASCQPPVAAADPRAWEEVRAAHCELRALAVRIADPQLRRELL
ncbi:MAG: GAF domain-containing protein, partial [Streptomyces sp.]|nr:GAF domain-containing protein [Streptomyces sp.]